MSFSEATNKLFVLHLNTNEIGMAFSEKLLVKLFTLVDFIFVKKKKKNVGTVAVHD